ncbi:MAG: CHAT domain-containing protein [Acidobacteria bacterium]|nr:CHAT domain-containing protein [Acidobacteriota bacterium]
MDRPIALFSQSNKSSKIVCLFIFCLVMPLVEILGSASAFGSVEDAISSAGVGISVQNKEPQAQVLEPGRRIEMELAGGQSNSYQISMTADQYARVVINQRGVDVTLRLFGPEGKYLTLSNSEVRLEGEESISWVAETAGVYSLNVKVDEKNALAGRYEIYLLEVRSADEKDRALHEANKLFLQAVILLRDGKYDNAIVLTERRREIYKSVLTTEDRKVIEAINFLAKIYYRKGDYTKAEQLLQNTLKTQEKALAAEHPDLAAEICNLLGSVYFETGKYLKAEPFWQRSLEILKKSVGQENGFVATVLNNLALLYLFKGDYDQADSIFQRVLVITEKVFGPENNYYALILSNLGYTYYRKKDYAKAESYYKNSLSINEKLLKPDNPDFALTLSFLAHVYREREDYERAESHYQRALGIWEKSIGSEHHFVATALYHLATLYHKRGDYGKAEPLYLRSLAIREKVLVADSFDIAESLGSLAELYAAKGEVSKAITFLERANDVCDRNMADYLITGSERQKLAYLSLFIDETNLTLSLQSQIAPNDPRALSLALNTLLHRKGTVLDSQTDTINTLRRRARPEDQELFSQLTEARSQYATLKLRESGVSDSPNIQNNLKLLKDKIEKLEGELSVRNKEFSAERQPVKIGDVQSRLPAASALVELALYQPQDPQTKKSKPERYIAYLLTEKGEPKWVDLGDSATINRMVDVWRSALRDPRRNDVRRLGRKLDEMVMQPVRSLLGDARHLLIAPDDKLNLIPFAALVDENNRFLIERYTISYLTSGRDLLRLQESQVNKGTPLIVANPVFGKAAIKAVAGNQSSKTSEGGNTARVRIDQSQVFFQPLPGTEDEALAIKEVLPEAMVLLGEQATEAAIKEAPAPSILHIATHGYFFSDQTASPPELRATPSDKPQQTMARTKDAPAPVKSIRYTVQLQATPDLETAREKVKGFRGQGLDVYILKARRPGMGTIYRLRVGNFAGYSAARKFVAELRSLGYGSKFFIAPYKRPPGDLAVGAPLIARSASESANDEEGPVSPEAPQSGEEPLEGLRLSKFVARVEDPLLRSGLALAGANQGKSGDKDDGLLTAMEASGLNLSGTKLVVLSACDTGVGDLRTGEGVQGLRRALVLAGSESQVISLWPVPDQSTKDLMFPYYQALQQGAGRSEGLRQVQLQMLKHKEQRHPFYWAAFIQSGDWANLEGKR